ncbi:MAG TPA: hypothetical protein VNZ26_19130 [Vicinamibacterales bacterium]|nr:hypothetical protein [Vicinamibacterales bacterium]
MTDPRADYTERLERARAQTAALDRRAALISAARLLIALVGAVLFWFGFVRPIVSPMWTVLDGLLFVVVVVVHSGVLEDVERSQRRERIYASGIDRLNGQWAGLGRDGAQFLGEHAYARDLDLFGRGSLFELLNTARTEAGELTLADWLRAGAPLSELLARQLAVDELRGRLDFREDIAILAANREVTQTGALAKWSSMSAVGLSTLSAYVFLACAVLSVSVAALVFEEQLAARWLLAWVLAQSAIAFIWRAKVQTVLTRVDTADRDLGQLSALLARIEREQLRAPRLRALQSALLTEGIPPSRRITQLRRLVSWLDSTRNQLFAPVAALLLLRHQIAVAIDRWHRSYGNAVGKWLRVVGELEALAALATHAYEHPNDPFPELASDGPLFDAESLGHPLLLESGCVRNDVRLGVGSNQAIVISGSNMSGKSTLLRSVGANVVLALAGGPVRAARLRLSPLVLGATLRIEDSLQEGRSRFFAEILRIRAIVELAKGVREGREGREGRDGGEVTTGREGREGHPRTIDNTGLLFLLDEILHGTNSYDRRIGAEAIVQALVAEHAIGIVTTHDLALTELPAKLSERGIAAVNMHFEDRLEDGRMIFDYKMRPGVVEHSNALALMRSIGLEV